MNKKIETNQNKDNQCTFWEIYQLTMAGSTVIQYHNVNGSAMASSSNSNSSLRNNEEQLHISTTKHLNISAELLQNVLYGKLTSTSSMMKLCPSFPGEFHNHRIDLRLVSFNIGFVKNVQCIKCIFCIHIFNSSCN